MSNPLKIPPEVQQQILSASNREKRPLDCSGYFFLILCDLFTIFSMVSAADQNRRDLRDFSAFGNDRDP